MHLPCVIVLHGAQFHDTPVRVGDQVVLAHEPTNPVDPNAVQANGLHGPLGYLPAKVAARALAEHGAGCRFAAEVSAVSDGPRRITVRVTAELPRLTILPAKPEPARVRHATPAAPGVSTARTARTAAPHRSIGVTAPTTGTPGRAARRAPLAVGEPAYSRSGRPLGTVVSLEAETAVVTTPSGEHRYPLAHLVGRPQCDA